MNSDSRRTKAKPNYALIAINLVATPNEQVEGLLCMFCQQVDPNRVVAALEPRSAEGISVHADAEPIALHGRASSRGHGAMSSLLTEYAAKRIV